MDAGAECGSHAERFGKSAAGSQGGLIEYSGSLARDYDETAVSGTDIFAVGVGAYVTSALTPLYMEIKNKTTGKKDILKKIKGTYTKSVDVDGYVAESYDFSFEEVATA